MKSSSKTLVIIALALLACLIGLVWFLGRPDQQEPVAEIVLDNSHGPAFEVHVVMPRLALPFGGILPDSLAKRLDGTPRELRLNQKSPGARFGRVEPNGLELKADGWNLKIETDAQGRLAPATHLVFPMRLGGRQVSLNCRPADPANGYLINTPRAGSNEPGGRFEIELAKCRNADSGKAIEWPPAPLTVRGSFVGSVRAADDR